MRTTVIKKQSKTLTKSKYYYFFFLKNFAFFFFVTLFFEFFVTCFSFWFSFCCSTFFWTNVRVFKTKKLSWMIFFKSTMWFFALMTKKLDDLKNSFVEFFFVVRANLNEMIVDIENNDMSIRIDSNNFVLSLSLTIVARNENCENLLSTMNDVKFNFWMKSYVEND